VQKYKKKQYSKAICTDLGKNHLHQKKRNTTLSGCIWY